MSKKFKDVSKTAERHGKLLGNVKAETINKPNMTRTHSPERIKTSGASKRLAKNIASKPGLGKRKPDPAVETDADTEESSPILKYFSVAGIASAPNSQQSIGVLVEPIIGDQTPLIFPPDLLYDASGGQTKKWLFTHGLTGLLKEMDARDVAPAILNLAEGKKVTVIATRGYHKFTQGSRACAGYAWQGTFYPFGTKLAVVKLTDVASAVSSALGDSKTWNSSMKPYLGKNPRLLVAVCYSLASAINSPMNRKGGVVALKGPTTTGKTTISEVCGSMVGDIEDLIKPWTGSRIGIEDRLSEFGDMPSFLDEMHKASPFSDVLKTIMAVGNRGTHMVSKRTNFGGNSAPQQLKTNLIVTSEKGILELAGCGSDVVDSGIFARYFEIHVGSHGMFDDLCGHKDGASLSAALQKIAMNHRCTVWTSWLAALSKEWARVEHLHANRLDMVRDRILKAAGNPNCDPVTSRMVDSLSFAAFAGRLASIFGILDVDLKTITTAFGLVLMEHIARQPKSADSIAQDVIDTVAGFLQSNPGSFVPLSQFGSEKQKNGIAGYTDCDSKYGELFLFNVAKFKEKFHGLGPKVYDVLRQHKFLVAHKNRNNRLMKWVPGPKGAPKLRSTFIAIKKEILYAE